LHGDGTVATSAEDLDLHWEYLSHCETIAIAQPHPKIAMESQKKPTIAMDGDMAQTLITLHITGRHRQNSYAR
jgi:hypothetical protein